MQRTVIKKQLPEVVRPSSTSSKISENSNTMKVLADIIENTGKPLVKPSNYKGSLASEKLGFTPAELNKLHLRTGA